MVDNPNFPELSSFGTLLGFALALEQNTAALARAAAARDDCAAWRDALESGARKHDKRHKQLERMKRERLNEVVLQPIKGMARDEYVPALELPAAPDQALATVAAADETTARFYDDAAAVAVNVLGGLDRTFRRLAKESRALASGLRDNP